MIIRQLDCENRVVKSCKISSKSIKLGQSWSKFKVGSKTTGFDQIRLFKEVLSEFWVLISDLRFSWFSCFYQFQVLKWQSQKSFANIRGHFVGFWLYFADRFLDY